MDRAQSRHSPSGFQFLEHPGTLVESHPTLWSRRAVQEGPAVMMWYDMKWITYITLTLYLYTVTYSYIHIQLCTVIQLYTIIYSYLQLYIFIHIRYMIYVYIYIYTLYTHIHVYMSMWYDFPWLIVTFTSPRLVKWRGSVPACAFPCPGAFFVLKLGWRPKPWGHGDLQHFGSVDMDFCYSLVGNLVVLQKQRQVFDQAEFFRHHSSIKFPAIPDPNLKGIEKHFLPTHQARHRQAAMVVGLVIAGYFGFGFVFHLLLWPLSRMEVLWRPRLTVDFPWPSTQDSWIILGTFLGLPQWFWRVSNAVRTTSRSQRTQRRRAFQIAFVLFLLPMLEMTKFQLTAHVPLGGMAPPKFCRLVALLQNCFCPYRWPDLPQLASTDMPWVTRCDTEKHGDHGARMETKAAEQEKIRWRRGGPSCRSFSLQHFECQWISSLGAKGPTGPKRGEWRWVKFHIIYYHIQYYGL